MKRIRFSDVGVVVNSMEDVDEIYLTYTALGIPFADDFKNNCIEATANLTGWFIQATVGNITTKIAEGKLFISLLCYPIRYSMDILDFAVACHLLNSNQTEELIAHLDKHCKECK